jgi:hypothetical protein
VEELFTFPACYVARHDELFGVEIGRHIVYIDAAARAGLL